MRYSNPVPQLSDPDSKLIVGGRLYFYLTNTTTLKTIYADSSLTIPQNNPVITDSSGALENIFLDGLYKVVQKDDKGVQLWERDPVGEINYNIRTSDAGGTVDAITAVFDPTIPSLTDEKSVIVRALGANATTTPTFSPDGLTAKTITKNGNQALAIGDIFGLNHVLILQYNLTNDVWELLSPALGAGVVNTTALADNAVTAAKLASDLSALTEDWHEVGEAGEPGFVNSWVNFGSGNATAAFYKDPWGEVYVKGRISTGSIGATAFTLPVEYRPALRLDFGTTSNDLFGSFSINASGTVTPRVGSNTWLSINCSFRAA